MTIKALNDIFLPSYMKNQNLAILEWFKFLNEKIDEYIFSKSNEATLFSYY